MSSDDPSFIITVRFDKDQTMRVRLDLIDATVCDSEEVADGMVVDSDPGCSFGVESLEASRRKGAPDAPTLPEAA